MSQWSQKFIGIEFSSCANSDAFLGESQKSNSAQEKGASDIPMGSQKNMDEEKLSSTLWASLFRVIKIEASLVAQWWRSALACRCKR